MTFAIVFLYPLFYFLLLFLCSSSLPETKKRCSQMVSHPHPLSPALSFLQHHGKKMFFFSSRVLVFIQVKQERRHSLRGASSFTSCRVQLTC
ncbi:hypothetical protein BKA57DRAFT_473481 [Linnemannia elongata]|nr:hypothetical protein BKA57DRAFT_473481 [Linnemannia elongata]